MEKQDSSDFQQQEEWYPIYSNDSNLIPAIYDFCVILNVISSSIFNNKSCYGLKD